MKPNEQNSNLPKPPGVPKEEPILDENYDDYLEWTAEEEEAFLKILNEDNESN